ncbi:MAG: hypothetical protein ACREOC_15090, partial [Gemmatimonadales bacterium]
MPRSIRAVAWLPAALLLVPFTAGAQTPEAPAADSLHRAVGALTARLDSLESGQCPRGPAIGVAELPPGQDPSLDTLAAAVRRLGDRLERTIAARCPPGAAAHAATRSDSGEGA